MYLCDFHTHTSLCDGKSTPREMALRAIELGFSAYGFSGHGVAPFEATGAMNEANEQRYIREVLALKDELSGRLPILLGIENEYHGKRYSTRRESPSSPFDYVIGAVHVILTEDGAYPIDLHPSNITDAIEQKFGDFDTLAEEYFTRVAKIPERIDASIIAHIDLLSKFRDRLPLTFSERYYEAAFGAVKAIIPYGIPFEINVGAISRGYRSEPYPDPRILRYIRELGGEITVNGDCHSAASLGKHLDLGERLALECGFERKLILTKAGYEYKPLGTY